MTHTRIFSILAKPAKLLSIFAGIALQTSCSLTPNPSEEYVAPISRDGFGNLPGTCIEFDDFAAGDIVNVAYTATGVGPVAVQGMSSSSSGNAAMVFNTSAPNLQTDLGTPNSLFGGPGIGDGGYGFYFNAEPMGNALVVSADGVSSSPQASMAPDSRLMFDFSGLVSVTCYRITLIDVDENETGRARFYGTSGHLLMDLPFTVTGDNGVAELSLGGITGVQHVELALGGAVGVDRFCFKADSLPPVIDTSDSGCTRTIGFWKTHAGFGPQDDEVSAYLPISLGSDGGAAALVVSDAGMARDVLKQNVYSSPSNGITKLYAQLLAAKLNIAASASPIDIAPEILAADAFLALHAPTDWSGLTAAEQDGTLFWKDAFDAYNNGVIGPGHCDDGSDEGPRTGQGNKKSKGKATW